MVDPSAGSRTASFDTASRRIADCSRQQLAAVPSEVWATSGLPADARNAVLGFPDRSVAAGPETETAIALFDLHSGSTVIKIELEVDLTVSNPYVAVGGTVTGVPSMSPEFEPWAVTSGSVGISGQMTANSLAGQSMLVVAERTHLGSTENTATAEALNVGPSSLIMIGFGRPPDTYPGIWGYDGFLFEFFHDTLFLGWQPSS
jgi:hypothetical protein